MPVRGKFTPQLSGIAVYIKGTPLNGGIPRYRVTASLSLPESCRSESEVWVFGV